MSLSHLNPMQLQAATTLDGPLLILAGAGSGKTTVLISRIAQLIEHGVAPWSILAITFTNKAAGELKERLQKQLGPRAMDIWAATFHSACVRILRRDIEKLGFARSFTIYDTDDSVRVIKDVLKVLNYSDKEFPPKAVLAAISRAKDSQMTPDRFAAANAADYRNARIAAAYAEYQKRLKEANALDFDDIILHTVTLLQNFPEVREFYQNRFRYILVDEYQDTNHLQYLLTSLLAEKHKNLCVVGDDDQSIYRFRGATIENILSFEKQYRQAKVIRLEENYRSTGCILEAANGVIAHNQGRKGKTLWTAKERGEDISLFVGDSESDEAAYVADTVLAGRAAGRNFRDYCVLYRMNAQSNRIEDALRRAGVPYRIIGGVRFYDRMEVKDMLSYLCVLYNPSDAVRLKRIINTPARGIGDKTVEIAEYLAGRDGKSLFEIIRAASSYPELARAARSLGMFSELIDSLRRDAAALSLPELYELLLERSGYLAALLSNKDIEAIARSENVRELGSSITHYCENADEPSLGGFLDEVALFTDLERYDEAVDTLVMMTMHSAKGLEFPAVFLVGAEEGIFPGNRVWSDPQELEEERRLCYVAITRAREKLHITAARQRLLYGQTNHNPLSRFVSEIPPTCLEKPESLRRPARTQTRPTHAPASEARKSAHAAQPPAAPLTPYQIGDILRHKVFGRGLVTASQPMGGDVLLEIAFDETGTKKLMQKTAAPYLTKE